MSLTLTSKPTAVGASFNYAFADVSTLQNGSLWAPAHLSLNASAQVVNPATDDTLQLIHTLLGTGITVSWAGQTVAVSSIPLATNAATESTQANILAAIDNLIAAVEADALPTGASTAAGQAAGLLALQQLHTDITANPLPSGASTDVSLQAILSALKSTLAVGLPLGAAADSSLQSILVALGPLSTAAGQASILATLQAIDLALAPLSTAAGQTSALNVLQLILAKLGATLAFATQSNSPRVTAAGTLSSNYNGSVSLPANVSANAAIVFVPDGMSTGVLQVLGAWSGTLSVLYSIDGGITFWPTNIKPLGSGGGAAVSSITANGTYQVNVSGYSHLQVQASGISGAAAVSLAAANGFKIARVEAPTSDPLPTQVIATAFVDRSGQTSATTSSTSGTGYVFTTLAPANPSRQYFRINNTSQATIYIYDKAGGTPTSGNSIQIAPGGGYVFDTKVSNAAILVSASAASASYEAAEG